MLELIDARLLCPELLMQFLHFAFLGCLQLFKHFLTLGIIAHAFSLLLLLNAGDYAIYLASGSLFLFSLNFVFPFQMGILAEHDRDGSMAVIALVVQLACLATGPYVGGLVHAQTGPAGVLAFSAISFGLALLLFLLAARKTPVIQA